MGQSAHPEEHLLPSVCIVVINWNGKQHLSYSLPSVMSQDYPNYRVVVVDNASTDGSPDYIRQICPMAKVIENARNLGYTGAANVGIEYTHVHHFDYLLLLANDVVLDRRCVSVAVSIAMSHGEAALIGFNMIGAMVYEPFDAFVTCGLEWRGPEVTKVGYVEGAAFLARVSLMVGIGGYDEMLIMYGDENDLEARLMRAGYVLLRANIPVWHNSGRNVMGEQRLRAAYYAIRNSLIIWTRHYSLKDVLRGYISIVRNSCDPFVRIPVNATARRRTRPSNIVVNAGVILVATLSFLFKLKKIGDRRRSDSEAIAKVRFSKGS